MKKVVFILILIISLLIINNLVRSIYSLWNKQALLVNAKSQLEDEKKKHAQLQQQLAQVKNPQLGLAYNLGGPGSVGIVTILGNQ